MKWPDELSEDELELTADGPGKQELNTAVDEGLRLRGQVEDSVLDAESMPKAQVARRLRQKTPQQLALRLTARGEAPLES